MGHGLRAGVARADITPPIGIAHANWGAQTHQRAAGVDLPLWATALALGEGDEVVVIVDLDLVYLWEEQAQEALRRVADMTGLAPSHIRLAYAHTHSGSEASAWVEEGAEMVRAYRQNLYDKIAGIAWAAMQNMRPARIAAASGSRAIGVNRRYRRPEDGMVVVGRNWQGPVDHEVQVVRVDGEDGRPLAAIVNYACHPITVGPDNDLITPDYPGAMRRVVERATGATCLFLQGAAGDVGPVRGVARGGIGEYKRLGAILGHEASRLWWQAEVPTRRERYLGTLDSGAPHAIYADDPVDDRPAGGLLVGTRRMRLPLKEMPSLSEVETDLEHWSARVKELRRRDANEEDLRGATMGARRASIRAALVRSSQGQTHQTFEAQAFVVGGVALVGMPGEPFVETGLTIKRRSPFARTLFSGYSNVGWAYIPTPDAYDLGGYEVEIATPLASGASEIVVEEVLALLGELSGAQ